MEDGASKLGMLRREGNEKNLKSSEAESPRWQSRRTWAHLLLWELQNNNSLLNKHWQENVGCHQKKILHIQGQRKTHSKMTGGAKSFLESNLIPPRDTQRAQQTLCTPGPRDPTETEPELCMNVSCRSRISSGLPEGQGLWIQQTWVWHKPSWRKLPLAPPQRHQNSHRTGETDSWRAQTKPCVHQDTGERSSDPTRDWPRLSHECPGVSGTGMGQWWPATGLGELSAAVSALLKEIAIIFNTSTKFWPQVKQ